MATQADFWGDIEPTEIRTPVSILREQAALLGGKTGYLIEGKVDTAVSGGMFRHSLSLVVPTLDNYEYELLKVRHGVELYPVTAGQQDLKTESEFTNWLRQRLSSAETRKVIGNLLAQAGS
jgi:hypothetical protein